MPHLNDTELNDLRLFLAYRIQADYASCDTAGHGFSRLEDMRPIDGRQPAWTRLDETENVRLSYDVNYLERFSPERMKKSLYATALLVQNGDEETLLTLVQGYAYVKDTWMGKNWNPKWDRPQANARIESEFIHGLIDTYKDALDRA